MSRFTIDGDKQFTERLEQLAQKREVPKSEIIKRALSLYFAVERNLEMDNEAKLMIVNKDMQPTKELVLV
jgi:predicted transcriptional regulator